MTCNQHGRQSRSSTLRLLGGLAACTLATAPAAAQSAISSPSQFDGCEVLVDFEGLATPLSADLAALGVEFSLSGGSGVGILDIDDVFFPRQFGPAGSGAMVNSLAAGGACPCEAIQLDFAAGLLRVGFEVRNDPLDDVQIALFDSTSGLPVGAPIVIPSGGLFTFVGVESAALFDRAVISAVGAGAGSLQVDNLRFEFPGSVAADDFDGAALDPAWSVAGAAGTTTAAFGVTPPSGSGQAILASGAGVGAPGAPATPADMAALLGVTTGDLEALAPGGPIQVGSAMVRTFNVSAGDRLTLEWDFLTNESTPDALYNDFAFVVVDGVAGLLADTNTPGFVLSPSVFQQETGYRSYTHVFAAAGAVSFGLGVMDVEDASAPGFESGLLVDCLRIDSAPTSNLPPTCSVDLTAAREDFLEDMPGEFVVTEGETFVVPFTAIDPEGGILFASAVLPTGAGLSPLSGPSPLTSALAFTPSAAQKAGAPYFIDVTFSDDQGATTTCGVIVSDINLRPTCDAGGGPDATLEVQCSGPEGAVIQLAGSASDPDDALADLEFLWAASDASVIFDDATLSDPVALFPIGVTLATLTVSDGRGGVSTCDVEVIVSDMAPPEVSCTTSVAKLWPPKHDMRPVGLVVYANDDCSLPGSVQIVSATVRSDEPDNAWGWGDGNTCGDTNGQDGYTAPVDITGLLVADPLVPGRFTATVYLRAERAGNGDGRAYTFDVTALDSSGNSSATSCVVVVPRNKKKKGCGS